MPRPEKRRRIGHDHSIISYGPCGRSHRQLPRVDLSLDEIEAIRLCYLEDLYQEEAAEIMKISRQTLGRILHSANHKVADFLINNKVLFINTGNTYFESIPCRQRRRRRRCHLREAGYGRRYGVEDDRNREN